MFSIEQLQAFIAVAEELHFGRAAARLHMSQPPLTRIVQRLESDLGVKLFHRNSRNVSLSYAGKVFLNEAYRIVNHAENAAELTRMAGSGSLGVLRLGFTPVSGVQVLGDVLTGLAIDLPEVRVVLREQDSSEEIQERLVNELDLGLARPSLNSGDFESVVIQREQLIAVVPEAHPLAALNRPLVPRDFEGSNLIGFDPAGARYFTDRVRMFLGETTPRIVHQVMQNLSLVALVSAGVGVAFVSDAAKRIRVEGVKYIQLDEAYRGEPLEIHALWRRDNNNPVMQYVVDFLRAYGAPASSDAN